MVSDPPPSKPAVFPPPFRPPPSVRFRPDVSSATSPRLCSKFGSFSSQFFFTLWGSPKNGLNVFAFRAASFLLRFITRHPLFPFCCPRAPCSSTPDNRNAFSQGLFIVLFLSFSRFAVFPLRKRDNFNRLFFVSPTVSWVWCSSPLSFSSPFNVEPNRYRLSFRPPLLRPAPFLILFSALPFPSPLAVGSFRFRCFPPFSICVPLPPEE